MNPTALTALDLDQLQHDPQESRPTWDREEDKEAEAATVSEMEEWEIREDSCNG